MQTTFILFIMALAIVFSKDILSYLLKYDPIKEADFREQYPIQYPIEGVEKNYLDVLDEIESCISETDMKRAYVRIIIFSACYSEHGKYLSDLWFEYENKETELNIFS